MLTPYTRCSEKHKFVKRGSDEGNNDHEIRRHTTKHVAKYLAIKQIHTTHTSINFLRVGLTPNTSQRRRREKIIELLKSYSAVRPTATHCRRPVK